MHPRNVQLIRRLASKGKSVEQIAAELEESLLWQGDRLPTSDAIANICNQYAITIAEMRKVYHSTSGRMLPPSRISDTGMTTSASSSGLVLVSGGK